MKSTIVSMVTVAGLLVAGSALAATVTMLTIVDFMFSPFCD